MPTSSRPSVLLAPIGRGDHTSPIRTCTAPLAKKRVIAKPVRTLAVAIRNTPAPAYVSDGSLSFCGKRKGGKNAAKTKVLESFFAVGVSSTSVSSYLADRDVQNLHLAFVWSLRRHPLAAHAGPRCPDAAGKHFASAVLCATFLVIVS